jgi:hypothetical protein
MVGQTDVDIRWIGMDYGKFRRQDGKRLKGGISFVLIRGPSEVSGTDSSSLSDH